MSKKVLIVDDEPNITKVLTHFLESYDVEVRVSGGVLESHSLIINEKFDLILLDYKMHKYNGDKLVDTLKITDSNFNTPVIVVSGNLNGDIVSDLTTKGVEDFIEKPIDKRTFIKKVGRFLGVDSVVQNTLGISIKSSI